MSKLADRHALVVGATGLVGNKLVTRLIQTDAYCSVATLGRRAPNLRHERLTHHIADFADYPGPTSIPLPGADVLFCCLGTTIKQAGSRQAFRAIDHDLIVSIARQAVDNGTESFVVVSSIGADPETANFYLRTKGEMEQSVTRLGFERLGILRPSLLLGAREELRPMEQLSQYAARLINPFMSGALSRYRAVDATTVAAAMIGLDQRTFAGIRIIEGNEIWVLAEAWR